MKLLVVGEGPTEFGPDENQAIPAEHVRDGVGQILIRRLLGDDGRQIIFNPFRYRRLKRVPAGRAFGATDDESNKARLAADEARRQECDGLVFLRDADRVGEDRRASITAGLTEATVPVAIGIATETIEAWLLADPDAFHRAFRVRHSQSVDRPEALWGDRVSAKSRHPKLVWQRACAEIDRQQGRDTASAIADHLDLALVQRQCPAGFGQFAASLARMAAELRERLIQ